MLENFSPKTINSPAVREWLEMFTAFPVRRTPGLRAQLTVVPTENRLPAYRSIGTETLVIGFADDVITRPHWAARSATQCRTGDASRSPMPDTWASWSAPIR